MNLFQKLILGDGGTKEVRKDLKAVKEEKKVEVSSSSSSSDTSDSDDQFEDQPFQEIMFEEYKVELKTMNPKALNHHFDFKMKLQAMTKLSSNIQSKNKQFSKLIVMIEHTFVKELVNFKVYLTTVDLTQVMLKSQLLNMERREHLLEVNIYAQKKKDLIQKFCQQSGINITDEVSLMNYVFSITEAQKIALESKKLILEIQNFKTDQILEECKQLNIFTLVDMTKTTKKPDYDSLRDLNMERFKKFVSKKKKDLQDKIHKNLKYRGLPSRMYMDREQIYTDIRSKLYANLYNAAKLVLEEGERIIKRYNRLEFYIEELAFGKKKTFAKKNNKRNLTVDILMKKQKMLKPSQEFINKNRGSTLNPRVTDYGKYRFTMRTDQISPDKKATKDGGSPFQVNRNASRGNSHLGDNSTLTIQRNDRVSQPNMYRLNSQNENMDGTNASKIGTTQRPGQNEKEDEKLFIQCKAAQGLDQLIKAYCTLN